MAKQLFICRHAKSDWGDAGLRDFDRPLNKRGQSNAPEMAQRLIKQNIYPELVVSSPALRALTTAKHYAQAWQIPADAIQLEREIYEANVSSLLALINGFDNQYQKIAVFGHNPGFTDLVNYFDGHIYNLPTSGVVILEFPFDSWAELSANTGKVLLFDYPKSIDD